MISYTDRDAEFHLMRYLLRMSYPDLTQGVRLQLIQDYINYVQELYKMDYVNPEEFVQFINIARNIARIFGLVEHIRFDIELFQLASKIH